MHAIGTLNKILLQPAETSYLNFPPFQGTNNSYSGHFQCFNGLSSEAVASYSYVSNLESYVLQRRRSFCNHTRSRQTNIESRCCPHKTAANQKIWRHKAFKVELSAHVVLVAAVTARWCQQRQLENFFGWLDHEEMDLSYYLNSTNCNEVHFLIHLSRILVFLFTKIRTRSYLFDGILKHGSLVWTIEEVWISQYLQFENWILFQSARSYQMLSTMDVKQFNFSKTHGSICPTKTSLPYCPKSVILETVSNWSANCYIQVFTSGNGGSSHWDPLQKCSSARWSFQTLIMDVSHPLFAILNCILCILGEGPERLQIWPQSTTVQWMFDNSYCSTVG